MTTNIENEEISLEFCEEMLSIWILFLEFYEENITLFQCGLSECNLFLYAIIVPKAKKGTGKL